MAVSGELRQTVKKWFDKATASLNKQSDAEQLGSPGSNRKKTRRRSPRPPAG